MEDFMLVSMENVSFESIVVAVLLFICLIFYIIYVTYDYKERKKERTDYLKLLYELHYDLDKIESSLNSISWEFTGLREDLEERSKK